MMVRLAAAKTIARLAALMVVGVLAAGCDGPACPDAETLSVKVAGTCAAGPTTAMLSSAGCGVGLISSDPTLRLPTTGQLDQAREPLRQGGWVIYGSVCPGGPPCPSPADFRRCIATRIGSRLVLDCLDGNGATACRAELSE
jgi:hypothetical protein